ncbi:FGGY family carbohydrate kinase [Amycolatopsis sp. H20-H5]|uniref:FGGY family carbohydrate kinase n=1 Tax=Amycolatopsis sp. H20-H5 TaxID=3046309 RepID=UPI002DB7C9CA|nr:FGGY family carbohydrate kinase [Amycolatopsis sp. H20-H5]MEC3975533.1 FGGY family carbohydrate kinase [Amycolatopsis sp. H20-H5]
MLSSLARGSHRRSAVVLGVSVTSTAVTVATAGDDLIPRVVVEQQIGSRFSRPATARVRPAVVLHAVVSAVREAAGISAAFGEHVLALSITCEGRGLIRLDEDGCPLTDDLARDSAPLAVERAADQGPVRRPRTGPAPGAGSPMIEMITLAADFPDAFRDTYRWTNLKGFLVGQLTGEMVADTSTWSGSGLLDEHDLDWAETTLDEVGVRRAQLPELTSALTVIPLTTSSVVALDVPWGTQLIVGGSAQVTTHLGTGAGAPGTIALDMRRVAALSVLGDRTAENGPGRPSSHIFADGLWFKRLTLGHAHDDGPNFATEPLGAPSPRLPGYHPDEPQGHWISENFGQTTITEPLFETTRTTAARSRIESIARRIARLRDELTPTGELPATVHATGNILGSPLWSESVAAALDAPLAVVASSTVPALGATLVARRGLGLLPNFAEPARQSVHLVQPDPVTVAFLAATRVLTERQSRPWW